MHVGAEKSWKKARFLIETYRAVTTSKSCGELFESIRCSIAIWFNIEIPN